MLSPAKKHRMRALAQKNSTARKGGAKTTNEDKQMLAALYDHKKSLSAIQSIEGKVKFKNEILPLYHPYISGVIDSNSGAEDRIISTIMVWEFDVGNISLGLEIAEYILDHNLSAPDEFKRTPATIIAENVAEFWLTKRFHEQSIEGGLSQISKAKEITEQFDMPDEARAKLHKALGFAKLDNTDSQGALKEFKRAFELDTKAGVKTEISRLEKMLSSD